MSLKIVCQKYKSFENVFRIILLKLQTLKADETKDFAWNNTETYLEVL